MKVLITGGAGYIGSTLCLHLMANKYMVQAFDNLLQGPRALLALWSHENFEFFRGDIRDEETMRGALEGVDAIVHLAAIVGDPAGKRAPEITRAVNLDATKMLIDLAKDANIERFVFASTCSNYGKSLVADSFVDEDTALNPISLYAETKVEIEKLLLDTEKTGEMVATPLRFATVYGVSPRMRFDLTVNQFPMEMFINKHLVVFGEQFWRPYIHVRDAAIAIQQILDAPADLVKNNVFNVGNSQENYRKKDIVNLSQKYLKDAVIERIVKEEDPRDYRVSFNKIKEVIGFETSETVEQGIVSIIKLLRDGVIEDVNDPSYRN